MTPEELEEQVKQIAQLSTAMGICLANLSAITGETGTTILEAWLPIVREIDANNLKQRTLN